MRSRGKGREEGFSRVSRRERGAEKEDERVSSVLSPSCAHTRMWEIRKIGGENSFPSRMHLQEEVEEGMRWMQ